MALAFLHGVGGGGKHLDDLKALIDRSITEFEIPEGVTEIGQYSIMMCNSLTNLVIPETVTKINDYGITTLNALEYLNIPDSVTEIGNNVLYGCGKMKEIRFGKKLEKIGTGCFRTLKAIISFDFTDCEQVPQLGTGCFALNNADAKIIVPASLYEEWIEATNWAAFKDCIVPTEPVPSKGFAYTHDYDNDCYILTGIGECTDADLVIPATYDDGINGNKQVYLANEAFRENTNITSVNILEGVGGSDWCYAFAQCPLLERVEGLHYIYPMFALTTCPSLSYVKFDKRVGEEGVGAYGFYGSRTDCVFDFSLVETIPTLGYDPYEDYQTFENLGADGKIIVPAALYDAWIVDTNWAMHADHIVKAE